jgi:hypothetical protein
MFVNNIWFSPPLHLCTHGHCSQFATNTIFSCQEDFSRITEIEIEIENVNNREEEKTSWLIVLFYKAAEC